MSDEHNNVRTLLGTLAGLALVVIPEPATTVTGLAILSAVFLSTVTPREKKK